METVPCNWAKTTFAIIIVCSTLVSSPVWGCGMRGS
jgi:hypothetical protein